jgi:hypothetical protein
MDIVANSGAPASLSPETTVVPLAQELYHDGAERRHGGCSCGRQHSAPRSLPTSSLEEDASMTSRGLDPWT